MALLGKFFGRTVSEGAAFAFGAATAPVLAPPLESLKQEAWMTYPTRALDAGAAAGIVAEDVELEAWGQEEAARHGINETRFRALLGEALNAPGVPELFTLWRRGLITPADFAHGLRKAKLEPRWDGPLRELHDVLLTPNELANARQQGFVSEARQKSEAALQGIDAERAEIQFELSGLPPGVDVMQHAANRRLIDEATFTQAVREGHTKTKYTDLLWQMRHPLLSAATYVRLYLKGWISKAERDAGGALWGYTSDQMEQWFLSEGRPATTHQVHIGYARGAKLPGAANEEDAIRTSVKESDIRPEYADLLYASRYTLPSAFVLRALVTSGDLSGADGERLLVESGWPPDLAQKVAAAWGGGGTTAEADPHVAKAQVQVWGKVYSSYIEQRTDDVGARAALAKAGVAASAVDTVLDLWKAVRALKFAELTPTQIKKAGDEPYVTRDQKIAALVARGYTATDAAAFVDE